MNNDFLNEANNLVNELSGNFERLLKLQKSVFNDLPPDLRKKTDFVGKTITEIENAVKNGDMDKLNEINKRYADINSK